MHATIRAHRARKARSPRYYDRRPLRAGVRSTTPTVAAARSRLTRSHGPMMRRRFPYCRTEVLRGEWPEPKQSAAIRRGGMDEASAWRSGAYGRPVPMPPVDRSMLPREERMGRPQRR